MTNRRLYSSTPSVNPLILRGCLIFILSFGGSLTAQAKTIFVKANAVGSNNGTSWTNAYNSLQSALSNAVSGDNIWVAKGTYKPSSTFDQNAFFAMLPNVNIYGSFAGTEANLADRTPSVRAANVSILSGDLDDNDDPNGNLNSNTFNFGNSYNVISNISNGLTTANALLDGFTISGGNTQDVSAGGGMLNANSSPSIVNVTFTRNYGRQGGGMFNNASSPSLSNVTFLDNAAGFFGGGMNNIGGSTPILSNVTFLNNKASYGGGMNNDNASPSLNKVTFSANSAGFGGGMYNANASSPSISNAIFVNNGTFGGIIATNGGGMYNTSGATPSLNNVTFWQNVANSGGGMYNSSSTPTIKNSIFWKNRVSQSYFSTISSIEGNAANVTYSDIEQTTGVYAGIGNINDYPMFALFTPNTNYNRNPAGNDGVFGTADDMLTLSPCSPAVNTGNNTGVASTDIVGNPRTFGGTVDMGAYESQYTAAPAGSRLYVNQAVANSGDGFSWATAFKDLQDALAFATSCTRATEIWVAKGTYKPTAGTTDRNACFKMIGDVKVYGSFAGTEATLADRTPSVRAANPTILSGDLLGNDVITGSGSTLSITGNAENSYHVFLNSHRDLNPLNNNSLLDGFIITGGNSQGEVNNANIFYPGSGGGMYIESYNTLSPTIANLSNLTFVGNNSGVYGGGIFCVANSSLITNNVTFSRNNAANSGGGIELHSNSGTPTINMNNGAFSGNNAGGGGGGMKCHGSSNLNNVTFWGNNAGGNGGAMLAGSTSIKNSIFWGNTTGGTTVSSIAGTPTVTYSDVEGGYTGTGNINQNPLFVNAANPVGTDGRFGTADDGLALTACSPAINAGNNTGVATTDITGNPRIFGGTVDMGAYESQAVSQSNATLSISGISTICQGNSTTLTLVGGSAGTGAIAEWSASSCSGTVIGTGNSITVSPTTPTTYFVKYNGACNTTACASQLITVNTPSVAPLSISGISTICQGNSTTLTLVGGSAGTGAVAEWTASSCGGAVIGTGNSITVSPSSSTTYFVKYNGTCNTTACASQLINVNTLSVAPSSISGTSTICSGGSTTLTLSGGFAGTGAVAEWFTSSCGGTPAGTGNSIIAAPTVNTTYFVRYKGICNTTSCASVAVVINTPSVGGTLSPAQSQGCGPQTVNLSVTGINGVVTQWERQANCTGNWVSIGSSNLSSFMVTTPNQTSCYRVKITNGVCPATYSTTSTITVDKPAVGGKVTLQSNQNATSIALCPSQNALLMPKNHVGIVAKWQYSFGTSSIWYDLPNSSNQSTITVNGTTVTSTTFYRVVIYTELGLCTGQASIAYSSAFRITKKANCVLPDGSIVKNEVQTKPHLSIQRAYPNPASDLVKLEIVNLTATDEAIGTAQIDIMDIAGRIVYQSQQNLQEGFNTIQLDIHNLSSGLYFIKIKDANKRESMIKLMKE